MILEKQQLIEAGTSFSQQYSLGVNMASPTMIYEYPNGSRQYKIILSQYTGAIISPAKTTGWQAGYNAADIGKTWSSFSTLAYYKKMISVANGDIYLFNSSWGQLDKITRNALDNSILNNAGLTPQSSSSLTVSVTTKSTNFMGQTSYSTANNTYSMSDLRDIDGNADIIICVGTFGLIYSLDNGSTWNKAANNISNLSITNVFIGTMSSDKHYIAVATNGKIYRTIGSSLTNNLTLNGDNIWSTQTISDLSSATIHSICQIGNLVFICTSIGLYYSDLTYSTAFTAVISNTPCYSIVKNSNGKYIVSTDDGIVYSDNLSDWAEGDEIASSSLFRVLVNGNERIIAIKNSYAYYSDSKRIPVSYITSKPLTQTGIQALIDECKAYVQSKKQS